MIFSADMAYACSHIPGELGIPGIGLACATSDPPIVCMQDIIDHEYALVESIPDEDRAALMPIIRFVRNTLQDPFTPLRESLHGSSVDALNSTNTARLQMHNNYCMDTHKEMEVVQQKHGFVEKNKSQGQLARDKINACDASMPDTYTLNVTDIVQHCYMDHNLDSCQVSMPWHRVTSEYQQLNCPGALHPKELHITKFDSPEFGNPRLTHLNQDNQVDQFHQLRGGFSLSSLAYAGLRKPSLLTSFKRDPGSNFPNICSSLEMDSFNLEELRRSLTPPTYEMDTDVNDIQSIDVTDNGDGVDGEDDNMDADDGYNGSFLYYSNQDAEDDASDVEWPLFWGNDSQYHPITSAGNCLQFPKVHCRRRQVIKKVVGWVKTRAAESLASRVRHKRKCNLPCCTGCETGTKRRKASGYGSKKCARLSTMNKIASSLTATTTINSQNATNSNRHSSKSRPIHGASASSDSCDDKEASQVTEEWDNSPLARALTKVLINSKSSGLTSCEALQALVQEGYLKAFGCESQALASHVKTTLNECPQFRELKNHRFILNAGPKQEILNSLQNKVAFSAKNCPTQDQKFSIRELSLSQVKCSEKRGGLLSQVNCSEDLRVDSSFSEKQCQKPRQGGVQCRKTDGKQWQCSRTARPGFFYCERHQQARGTTMVTTSGFSSYEIVDPCDGSYYEKPHDEAKEREMLETVVDSCSVQSVEEPIRCCRTDGKSWQCSNQAQKGSSYCERHQSRCKKGIVQRHVHAPCASAEKNMLPSKITQNRCVSHVKKFSMQLRPRRNPTLDIQEL